MYVSQDRRMIDQQAQIISTLRDDYAKLQSRYNKLELEIERNKQAAEFYLQLQAAILNNPILQSEWQRFCTFLKMADPSLDTPTPDKSDNDDVWNIPYMF